MNCLTFWSPVFRPVFLLILVTSSTPLRGVGEGDESLVLEGDEYEANFNFGDSCDRLDYLSGEYLAELVDDKYEDNWQRFCLASEFIECEEYSNVLEEFGYLSDDPESEFCAFTPNYKMYEWIPEYYEFYGHVQRIKHERGI